jgi:hypothetical protein
LWLSLALTSASEAATDELAALEARRTFCRAFEASLAAVPLLLLLLEGAVELEEASERDEEDDDEEELSAAEEVEVVVVASAGAAGSADDDDDVDASADAGSPVDEGRTPSCTAAGEMLSSGLSASAALSSASSAFDSFS